jgi:hypothetical protein
MGGTHGPHIHPPSKPTQATCIDHLALWDPSTIPTSFLDHCGVMGRISLPILIPPTQPIPRATPTQRVPTFNYPIPAHTLASWKIKVAVDSNSPTALAIATAKAILDNLEDPLHTPSSTEGDTGMHQG